MSFRRFLDPLTESRWSDRLTRIFGSFLDNLRGALNYLAYQAACRALILDPTLTDLRPEAVEFPIFRNPADYGKTNRIKKLPDTFRRVFEDVQPSESGYEDLWILHELAREYRHRIVHAVAVFPRGEYHGALGQWRPHNRFRDRPR